MKNKIFARKELLFLITISLALGIRQMAMTMVMPFISTYSKTLTYSNATLAGVALGVFGLMQAVFQIPFGMWSDKIGNKKVMLIGLMQVIIGLVIAFLAKSIYMLIFSRALQGSGAVLATGYSWVSGSVDDQKRPRALSFLGMIIGFSAAASFALGPLVNNYVPLKQMFLISAILIFIVWLIIFVFLQDTKILNNSDIQGYVNNEVDDNKVDTITGVKILLKNKVFVELNIAGFFNNYIMASVFFIVPIYLEKITGIDRMWEVFMPAVIIAILCMKIAVKFVEKGYSSKLIKIAFMITTIGLCFYFNKHSFNFILIGSILFMTGYISLATIIPSVANDIAEDSYRGTANGIINSFQYIGSFVGAVATGALWSNNGYTSLIIIIVISILGIFTVNNTKSENSNKAYEIK